MQNNLIKIAVTGHRDITIEQENKLRPVVAQAIKNIIAYEQTHNYKRPNCVILSALADGADCLVAEVGLELYQKLYYYLPFAEQYYIQSIDNNTRHNELVAKAAKTVVVEQDNFDAAQLQIPGYDGELYNKLGNELIADCDYIIAILDPTRQKNGKGGTKHVAEMAKEKGKILLAINPADENPIINFEYFFNDENVAEYRDKANSHEELDGNMRILKGIYTKYDKTSIIDKGWYEKLWRWCWRIGLAAALIFAIKLALIPKENTSCIAILSVLEFAALIAAYMCIRVDKAIGLYSSFIWARFIAENIRINELFYYCGYHNYNTTRKIDIKPNKNPRYSINYYIFKLGSVLLKRTEHTIDVNAAYNLDKAVQLSVLPKGNFCNKKLKIHELATGQITYHHSKISLFEKELRSNRNDTKFALGLFIITLIVHLLHVFHKVHFPHLHWDKIGLAMFNIIQLENLTLFLSLALPAFIARTEATIFINDWEKKINESEFMAEFFEEIKPKIEYAANDIELCQILNSIHNAMTNEVANWEVSMINKNEYVGPA